MVAWSHFESMPREIATVRLPRQPKSAVSNGVRIGLRESKIVQIMFIIKLIRSLQPTVYVAFHDPHQPQT